MTIAADATLVAQGLGKGLAKTYAHVFNRVVIINMGIALGVQDKIEKTVHWYLNNQTWWQRVLDGSYAGERLGLNN